MKRDIGEPRVPALVMSDCCSITIHERLAVKQTRGRSEGMMWHVTQLVVYVVIYRLARAMLQQRWNTRA